MSEEDNQMVEVQDVSNYYNQTITTAGNLPTNGGNNSGGWSSGVNNSGGAITSGLVANTYPTLKTALLNHSTVMRIYKANKRATFICSTCAKSTSYRKIHILEVISQEKYQDSPVVERKICLCSEQCLNTFIVKNPLV